MWLQSVTTTWGGMEVDMTLSRTAYPYAAPPATSVANTPNPHLDQARAFYL